MNILLSAYACEPGKGSEPEAGFQMALAASRVASRVTVLTRENNADSLKSFLPSNVEVIGFDLGVTWLRLKKWLPGGTQAYYWAWQRALPPVVAELHQSRRFDLVHHATFAADWMPVGAAMPGVPLVWGPVGGGTGLPWRMWRTIGALGLPRELIRGLVGFLFRGTYGRRVARRADLVIAQNLDEYRIWTGLAKKVRIRPNVVVVAPPRGESGDHHLGPR